MKRKLLAILTICTLAFSMTACGGSEEPANTSEAEESSADNNTESNEAEKSSEEASEESSTGYSSSVAKGLILELPEGFTKSEEDSTETIEFFCSPNYPNEVSNININVTANDGSLASTTTDMLVQAIESQLETVYQMDLTINVTNSDSSKIADRNALNYTIEYAVTEDMTVTQQQCIIENEDQLVFITFTSATGEDYADAYAACVDSIRFE